MTIHIQARHVVLILTALAFVALAVFASYSYGEGSRKSDTEVTRLVHAGVAKAVAERDEQAKHDQAKAVAAQRTQFAKRLKKVREAERDRGYLIGKKSGYQDGNNDGYAAGNSAGYSAGHTQGEEEGVEKASDELDCSDDSDAGLTPCWVLDY